MCKKPHPSGSSEQWEIQDSIFYKITFCNYLLTSIIYYVLPTSDKSFFYAVCKKKKKL